MRFSSKRIEKDDGLLRVDIVTEGMSSEAMYLDGEFDFADAAIYSVDINCAVAGRACLFRHHVVDRVIIGWPKLLSTAISVKGDLT